MPLLARTPSATVRPACPPMWLWSDLHLEFATDHAERMRPPLPPAGDIVLLAGDIGSGTAGVRWAIQTFPDNPVAYILGNHEPYHADLEVTLRACRDAAAGTNVRILERESWDVAPGTRVLGATLWTDYALWSEFGLGEAYAAARRIADHRLIVTDDRDFTPADAHRRHLDTRAWLEAELARAHADQVRAIVVTHHAPHSRCLGPDFERERNPLSTAFASDLEEILSGPHAPEVWASGHTHRNFVGTVGRTRLVSNQGGYRFQHEDADFLPGGRMVAGSSADTEDDRPHTRS